MKIFNAHYNLEYHPTKNQNKNVSAFAENQGILSEICISSADSYSHGKLLLKFFFLTSAVRKIFCLEIFLRLIVRGNLLAGKYICTQSLA